MQAIGLALLGVLAGMLSGLIGIGGGIIVVPALIILFGFSQQSAQGTTLAMLVPPIGILAAYAYYKAGFVDIRAAVIMGIAFIIGAFLGAKFAVQVRPEILQKIFGVILFVVSLKFIFLK